MTVEIKNNPQESEAPKQPDVHEAQAPELVVDKAGVDKLASDTVVQVQTETAETVNVRETRLSRSLNNIGIDRAVSDQELISTELPAKFAENQAEVSLLGLKATADVKAVVAESHVEVGVENGNEGLPSLIRNTSDVELQRLRGAQDYGVGLVDLHHPDGKVMTLEENEKEQSDAYKELNAKVEAGVVKPDTIYDDLVDRLKLGKEREKINTKEEIKAKVDKEIDEIVFDKKLITESEGNLIKGEAEKYLAMYGEAYPDANPQKVFEVVQDNARKLAYQTERDKHVFSGSDHGTKHILEGNMAMADKLLDSLGDKVSAKDRVLIHQIIIDHDIGYTTGAAEHSFVASKDHPLVSTKFVEANADYYIAAFGQAGFEMIRDGILQHSYVKAELEGPTDPTTGINVDMVRSVTSIVDSLGVTAETKCPAFFRSPNAIRVLNAIKLHAETHDGEVDKVSMGKYKEALKKVAEEEPNLERRAGFIQAIDQQFNIRTVDMTLGQYTGVLREINHTKILDGKEVSMDTVGGKIVPKISMDISRAQALLGNLFGDKIAIQAFQKAMKDFGLSPADTAKMAGVIRKLKSAKSEEERTALLEKLKFPTDKGVFDFSPQFNDISTEVEEVFEEFTEKVTIRDSIRTLTDSLKSPESRTHQNFENARSAFMSSVTAKAKEDLSRIKFIMSSLRNNLNNPNEFENSLHQFNNMITKREQDYMDDPLKPIKAK